MRVFSIMMFAIMTLNCVGCSAEEITAPPHIVILVADDLGLDVAPCHSDTIRMPYLQSLCARSLIFDRAYTHPYCTASRASLMTGRHPFRHGADDVRSHARKLPLSETTLAELITSKSAHDYQTAAFGKWHLADDQNGSERNPNLQGFDYFEGTPRQHHTYRYYDFDWSINGEFVGQKSEYKTTLITDAVLAYFEAHSKYRPQFAVVNYTNPHKPYHIPPRSLHSRDDLEELALQGTLSDTPGPNQYRANRREPRFDPYYYAMLEALDHEIERLVASLTDEKDRPILFVFLGDNGSAAEVLKKSNQIPIRSKATLYDGGVRVPLMIWSSQPDIYPVSANRSERLIHLVDLFPTIGELAGVSNMASNTSSIDMDGRSFATIIRQRSSDEHSARQFVFLERGNDERMPFAAGAVNLRGSKLILRETERPTNYSQAGTMIELYETSKDPWELDNLLLKPCDVEMDEVIQLFEFIASKLSQNVAQSKLFEPSIYRAELKRAFSGCQEN